LRTDQGLERRLVLPRRLPGSTPPTTPTST
jgi:hypothetical protein